MFTTQALLQFINHHLLLSGALVAALLALVANEIYGSLTGGAKLGAPQAVRLINDRDAKIIDLRPVAPFYRIVFDDGERFDYSGDAAAMRAEVARFAPAEVAG